MSSNGKKIYFIGLNVVAASGRVETCTGKAAPARREGRALGGGGVGNVTGRATQR